LHSVTTDIGLIVYIISYTTTRNLRQSGFRYVGDRSAGK